MNRVITFHSTHLAIKAERALRAASIDVRMIPVPRHISSNCGVAVCFSGSDENCVLEQLASVKVEVEGIFDMR